MLDGLDGAVCRKKAGSPRCRNSTFPIRSIAVIVGKFVNY